MKIEDIENPKFLKKMNYSELEILSSDIRKFLIDNVSKTGGHLSSNLGIVELTIMLHKVFDTPKDKIIFDVSHQSYVHKILTGRSKYFNTLRCFNGLSGFTNRSESIYDAYEAGHSSTSLSASLGFAIGRDMNKKKYNVISVIGDASIGSGISYEALNHIGSSKSKVIIILNDNNMSISKNVGALHNHLDKLRNKKSYITAKDKTKRVLNKTNLGTKISNLVKRFKMSIKKLYMKEGFIFEEFGIDYYGPINGHDFKELELYLNLAKKSKKSTLIHVITEKGKGYPLAEKDTIGVYHGVDKFDPSIGIISKSSNIKTYGEILTDYLIKIMNKDIVCITPAMKSGSKLIKFSELYPKNFIDVGICEEHALLLANGMSLEGKKPIVFIYSSFLQRGYDEVVHDIAKMNTNVIVCIDRCGIVGKDGETHQGVFDMTFLLPIPNIIISTPSNSYEVMSLLKTSINTNSPFMIRYSKNKINSINDKKIEFIEVGKWLKVNDGTDATLISYGDFLNESKNIVSELKKEGINIELVNALYEKPIDKEYFNKIIEKKKPIFVYEESMKIGSLGSYLTTLTNKDITIYAIEDEFVKCGSREELLVYLELDSKSIINKIRKKLKKC